MRWHQGPEYSAQGEVFEELKRTATSYDAVEPLPHVPPIDGHYYAWHDMIPGNGDKLREFIERFHPATDVDRDLVEAAFITPGWGGLPGARPCFNITSDDGRGAGKTKLAEMVGHLWGGTIDFHKNEDINKIKTRLLSSNSLSIRRVVLIDNVKARKFSWAELEAMITSASIGGHKMYQGEGTRPNTLTWFVTCNGASLSTDMAQRSVIIKITKPPRTNDDEEDAQARWETDTRLFIDAHRKELIADVIGVLQRPRHKLRRFTRWAAWENDILCRLAEPGEAQKVIVERQDDCDVEEEENDLLTDYFAMRLRGLRYDANSDHVFLPSDIAAGWYNAAQNVRETPK